MARRPSKLAKCRGLSFSCSSTTAGGMPSTGTVFRKPFGTETGSPSSFDTLIGKRRRASTETARSRARPRTGEHAEVVLLQRLRLQAENVCIAKDVEVVHHVVVG